MKGKYDQAVDSEIRLRGAAEARAARPARPRRRPGRARRGCQERPPTAAASTASGRCVRQAFSGTEHKRGERLSTGQVIARNVTRTVTTEVAGKIAADIGKSIGGSMGGSIGRAIVRGALGGMLRR